MGRERRQAALRVPAPHARRHLPTVTRARRQRRAEYWHPTGQPKRARADLERIYAEAPDYDDVARRLGMTT